MKKILLFILVLFVLPITAQEKEKSFFSNLNVALRASTLGYGVELATPIHPNFDLRAGLSYFSKDNVYKNGFDIKSLENEAINNVMMESYGHIPHVYLDASSKMINGNVLVDIIPVKNSVFHFTVGFYVGDITLINAKGYLSQDDKGKNKSELLPGKEGVAVELGGKEIKLDNTSTLEANFKWGSNTIKPYVGIGIGRAVTPSRVGAKIELGALYTGGFLTSINDTKIPTKELMNEIVVNNVGLSKRYNMVKSVENWFPVINFQLTFRLF